MIEPNARRRPGHRAFGVVVGVLVAGALAVGAPSVFGWWASRGRVVPVADAPARDVAVILGAEVYPSGTPSPYLRARLDLGAELFRSGRARVLIVSGDNAPDHNRETASMRAYLEAAGVPAAKIVEDEAGLDTYDTCVRARDVFGVHELLLVSQEYHLARAVATCRAVGVDAVGVSDTSVQGISNFWAYGTAREYAANVKMAFDVVSRRAPRQEPPSDAVREALRA